MVAYLARKALAQQGMCRILVQGGSMAPALRSGDTVTVVHRPISTIAVGDIVAFEDKGEVTVHRVRYRISKGLITVGDANILLDEPVCEEQLLGVATERLRGGVAEHLQTSILAEPSLEPTATYKVLVPHVFSETIMPLQQFVNFTIYQTDLRCSLETSPETSVGISTHGLYDESHLTRLLQTKNIEKIIYSFAFGPEQSGLFPIERVAAVVKLGVLTDSDSSTLQLGLSYLDGYLGAFKHLKTTNGYE